MLQFIKNLLFHKQKDSFPSTITDPQGFTIKVQLGEVEDATGKSWDIAFDGEFYYYIDQEGKTSCGVDDRDKLIMMLGYHAYEENKLTAILKQFEEDDLSTEFDPMESP